MTAGKGFSKKRNNGIVELAEKIVGYLLEFDVLIGFGSVHGRNREEREFKT